MPDIETEFKEGEADDLKWAAEQLEMTVEEFTAYAAGRLVKSTREDMRQRLNSQSSIKIIK